MQVAVFVKATPSSEAGLRPDEFTKTCFAEMGRFNEALVQAGVMKDGAGLRPSSQGVRVRFRGRERLVIDGPFAETRELVAGYWLWEVPSLAAATVLFDAIPPYRTVGRAAIRTAWADCLPHFPEAFTTDLRDVTVQASGGIAWAHFLLHFTPADPAHPCGQTWMRVTAAYQRRAGAWVSLHEHVSVPFNPMDNTAWFITDPARADAPDDSAGPCRDGDAPAPEPRP